MCKQRQRSACFNYVRAQSGLSELANTSKCRIEDKTNSLTLTSANIHISCPSLQSTKSIIKYECLYFVTCIPALLWRRLSKMAQVESRAQYWIIWDRKTTTKHGWSLPHDPPPRAVVSWKRCQSINLQILLVENIISGRMCTVYANIFHHWPKIVSLKHSSQRLACAPANSTRLETIGAPRSRLRCAMDTPTLTGRPRVKMTIRGLSERGSPTCALPSRGGSVRVTPRNWRSHWPWSSIGCFAATGSRLLSESITIFKRCHKLSIEQIYVYLSV